MIGKPILVSFMVVVSAVSVSAQMSLLEAVEAQVALTETGPDDALLFTDLGNLLLLVEREGDAESAYRRAIELDPELIAARFNLGLLLQQTRRQSKAQKEFRRVLEIHPGHAWSHYQLGVIHAIEGRRSGAIKRYAEALRLEPRLTDPAFNPHILDNPLAASATLRAYADLSSADLVPRIYESPRRVAGMLMPLPGQEVIRESTGSPKEDALSPLKRQRNRTDRPRSHGSSEETVEQPEAEAETQQDAKPVPKPPVRPVPTRRPRDS